MAKGSGDINLSASDIAAWFGAITGGISLGLQFYQEFKGIILVPGEGIEPTRPYSGRILQTRSPP